MIKKIKAAVLVNLKQPLEVQNITSFPLIRGQVLVKILFSGVCRSQIMECQGGRGEDSWLPHLLGHEGSGIVVAIGDGVTKVKVGSEVILGWIKGNGLDAPGAQYINKDQEVINSGRVTTFSNYSVVSESRLVKKPELIPFDQAVLFGCALPTGAGMAMNEVCPKVESLVLVLGLGGVGLSALMACKALGVKKIIAVDKSKEKLEMAKELGAPYCLNSTDFDFIEKYNSVFPDGADYCIESAGLVSTIELGFSLIKKADGELLFASHPPEGETISLTPFELISGKKIFGSWGGSTQPDVDVPKMVSLFNSVKTPLDKLLTKRYKLTEINKALKDLNEGRVFRPLIVMEHNEDE